MKEKDKRPYPVPVEVSKASGGTAIPVGWKIIIQDGNPFFVRVTDKAYENS